ncbi:nucleotidyltransferase domain-containing protein [Pseudonocardiaceae bacterium YIM PH 21723]|nr:nucleotidyltransferase domain-containing protein [Pseudonocardiaceae bacterium YIM PH 21723]
MITVFGSVVDRPETARDIDIAVAPQHGSKLDVLAVLDELAALTGSDDVDLLDLGRAGAVAREQALVYAEPLYESVGGEYAREQIRATMERMDTAWMRKADLELMAESGE